MFLILIIIWPLQKIIIIKKKKAKQKIKQKRIQNSLNNK